MQRNLDLRTVAGILRYIDHDPALVEEELRMATTGSITLGQVAERTASLGIACTRCDRGERYNVGALIVRHGANFGIPLWLGLLSAECPKRKSLSAYDLCGIHSPDLSALFLRGTGLFSMPPS